MTDKERLEEIEKNLDPLGYGMGGHLINVNDIYWLVKYARKQSERVEELESRITDDEHFVAEILEQNKHYRKAVKECVERMNAGGAGTRSFVYEKLSEALEGQE